MQKESQLIHLLSKEPLILELPPLIKLKIEQRSTELNLTPANYIIFLIENYDGNTLEVLTSFRYNLIQKVKKGINIIHIRELIKLKEYLEVILAKL